MYEFKTILFPVSLTPISPRVAPYVASVVEKYGANLHLLHVARSMGTYVDAYISQPSETDIKRIASDFEKDLAAGAESRLQDFKKRYFKALPSVVTTVKTGTHYKRILEYVDAEQIDLIVMGTGRGVLSTVFGSVTDKVAKLAPCPVMLIKTV